VLRVSRPITAPYRNATAGSNEAARPSGAGSAVAWGYTGPPEPTPAEPLLSRSAGMHSRRIGSVSRACLLSDTACSIDTFSSSVVSRTSRSARSATDRPGSIHGAPSDDSS
jgi:hypothetical protein